MAAAHRGTPVPMADYVTNVAPPILALATSVVKVEFRSLTNCCRASGGSCG
jgi:hypothetical protein